MNYTDCALLPEYDVCAPPAILYYSGEHCLMARAVCLGTFLAIQGTHIKTGYVLLTVEEASVTALERTVPFSIFPSFTAFLKYSFSLSPRKFFYSGSLLNR